MTEKDRKKQGQENVMTDVDFSGLVLGFSSAALYYIGDSEVEGKKISSKNLSLAKQNIRILELLKDKTQGNLSSEEGSLIDQVLNDLHLKYNVAQREDA
jgi:hypothetical protein